MKHLKKILFLGICTLLLFALIPTRTETIKISYERAETIHSTEYAYFPESFNKTDNDYIFLKCVDDTNNSAFTSFSLPPLDEHWMIEVTTLDAAPNQWMLDILNVSIFDQNVNASLDYWIPSATFPEDEYIMGAYNTSIYWIDPNFLSIFPFPFFVPLNLTAVNTAFDNALNANLSGMFQHYVFGNGTGLLENWSAYMGGMDMIPSGLHSIIVAYNGTIPMQLGNDTFPFMGNGTADGDLLIEAVYLGGGELHFVRESEWDNSSLQWNARYKLVSPIWELLLSIIEQVLPGSLMFGNGGGGMIPGFTCTALFLGLMIAIGIVYLRKPKQEIII